MPAPFGGISGRWNTLGPLPAPAGNRGYRVIPGQSWWRFVFLEWRVHLAGCLTGISVPSPLLGPSVSRGLYITDRESLQGLVTPTDFASRLSLSSRAHSECNYGCAVIEFDLSGYLLQHPVPLSRAVLQGLTAQGAREWIITDDVELNRNMIVTYVEIGPNGPRFYRITL